MTFGGMNVVMITDLDIPAKAKEIADGYKAAQKEKHGDNAIHSYSCVGLHDYVVHMMSHDSSYLEMDAVEAFATTLIWPHCEGLHLSILSPATTEPDYVILSTRNY